MLEYLEDKYGREFVVDQYRENDYWYGSDALIVHPKGQPRALFAANALEKANGNDVAYTDGYVLAMWSLQLTDMYSSKVGAAMGEQVAFKAAVFASDLRVLEGMENADVLELAEKYDLATIWYVAAPCDTSESCNERHAEGIFEVLTMLRESGFGRYALSVGLVSSVPRFESDVQRMDILGYEWGSYEDGVIAYFSPGFIGSASISNPQDVLAAIARSGDR